MKPLIVRTKALEIKLELTDFFLGQCDRHFGEGRLIEKYLAKALIHSIVIEQRVRNGKPVEDQFTGMLYLYNNKSLTVHVLKKDEHGKFKILSEAIVSRRCDWLDETIKSNPEIKFSEYMRKNPLKFSVYVPELEEGLKIAG